MEACNNRRVSGNFMKNSILILMIFVSTVGCSQTKDQKISFITKTYSENEGRFVIPYTKSIMSSLLYYHPIESDSLKLVELKTTLADKQALTKMLSKHLQSNFSEEEIDSLYLYYRHPPNLKTWVEKNGVTVISFSQTGNAHISRLKAKLGNFMPDIEKEVEQIQTRIREAREIDNNKIVKQKPITVNKQDGFYAVENYNSKDLSFSNLKLSANPSVSANDIERITKDFDALGRVTINISFNYKGGESFRAMTMQNKGKPIAIVLNHKIVSAPIVNETISGVKAEISGDFSEEEINEMINWKRNYR